MRAVSLWQPWATAWVLGIKGNETRHWSTDYRGPLAVHAAKRWTRDEAEWWERLHERDMRWPARPPLGAIVGVVQLIDVVATEALRGRISDREWEWGNYGPDRFGWIGANHRMLPEPIPFPGRQSFLKGMACAVLTDQAAFRMGLTATPIYNYGDEIHSVMDYIRPGLLGGRDEFIREWCGGKKIVGNPDGLGSYLRETGYFLRRREDDPSVDASMPPPNVVDWEVPFDEEAVEDEEAIMRTLAMTVLRGDFAEAGRAARELDVKMRQLTGIAKARSVAAYVKLLLRDCERVLLAGWHREVYTIWRQSLEAFKPVLYTGSETTAGKERSVQAFTKGDSRVLMISLRSGVGLDGLQYNCNDVAFGELDWSPQVHYQIIGRLRRPGQPLQVNAHYVHTNGGSDPVLMETLGVKADQSRGINDPGQAQRARFTDDSRIKRLAEHVLATTG